MDNVIAVILGGGRGTRLYPLTMLRSKPAVPIGGEYRLIDIPISNCLHADIRRIYILTQFNSVSLHRHIQQTYRFDNFSSGHVEILAAQQTGEHENWYQGTADAVRKQLRTLYSSPVEMVLILSGDQLYRINYRHLLEYHRQHNADITLAVQPVTGEAARRFGIVKADASGRVKDFHEKPQQEEVLADLKTPSRENGSPYLASMGIYVFQPDVLTRVLASEKEDFGRHIIPDAIHTYRVYAFPFEGYWEDIGTIRAFYEANLALAGPAPRFDLYSPPPLYTHARFLPGAKLERCTANCVIVGAGSVLVDSTIEHAVVGIRSRIGPNAVVRRSIVMGADFFETDGQRTENRRHHIPDVGVGQDAVVENAIIDKNARIGAGARIRNAAGVRDAETERYVIRDGIVVVPKNMVIPEGMEI